MQRRARYFLIAVAAAAAAGFALVAPAPAPAPTRGQPPRVATPVTQGGSQLSATLPERPAIGKSRGDLLAAQTWAPASAPPKPAPEVAAPAPPPMPYRFVGKVTSEGSAEHILAKGDLIFPVREGETLDGVYRVEALAVEEITILYLPLGVRTVLRMSLGSDAPALATAPYAIPVVPAPIASASAPPPPAANPFAPGPITSQAPDLTRTAATGTRAMHLRRERAQQLAPIKP